MVLRSQGAQWVKGEMPLPPHLVLSLGDCTGLPGTSGGALEPPRPGHLLGQEYRGKNRVL